MAAKKSPRNGRTPPSPTTGSSAVGQTVTRSFSDYVFYIQEHWIIALIFASAVAGCFGWMKMKVVPLYSSIAVIEFKATKNQVVNITEVVDNSLSRGGDVQLLSHITQIRSKSFRVRVVESLTEEEKELITKDYRNEKTGEEASIHAVIAGANKINRAVGQIFHVEFHHRNPEAAALLANRFIDEYVEYLQERSRRGNDAALRFLKEKSEELKLKVERGELAMQEYRQERNLVSLEESENLILARMKSFSGALTSAEVNLLTLQGHVEQVEFVKQTEGNLLNLPLINRFGAVSTLRASQVASMSERERLKLKYGRRHPNMIANATTLESIQEELDREVKLAVEDLMKRYEDQKNQVEHLQNALAEAEDENLELGKIKIEYNVLKRKMETDRALFTQILHRLNETVISSQLADPNLSVVDRAGVPGKPFIPQVNKIITLSVVIFIICFISLPIVISLIGNKLKTRADVEAFINKEYLGEVHRVSRRKFPNPGRIVLDQSEKRIVEQFRMLYSHITLLAAEKGFGILGVTSMVPKEGKTFVSSNMATVFAKHGHRVLIIDCDLRKPDLHHIFEVDNKLGVLAWYQSFLKGKDKEASKKFLGIRTVTDNLDLITSGGATSGATEVLNSLPFLQLIRDLKEDYDTVIVDTPPSGVFSDALLTGAVVEHFIFVCRQKIHNQKKVADVVHRLGQSKADVLGVMFNQTDEGKYARYGSNYYDYYYMSEYAVDLKELERKPLVDAEESDRKKKDESIYEG